MYIGKYLVFIVGIILGVGLMFAFGALSRNKATDETVVNTDAATPVVQQSSPFSVTSDQSAEEQTEASQSIIADGSEADSGLLLERIIAAESRIEELEIALADAQIQIAESQSGSGPDIQQEQQVDLVNAGFEPAAVDQIQNIRNDLQLQRLELRDRATREGWVGTDRYREERRELRGGAKLRETLGDDEYDKLLIAEGRNNRVRVDSVIENSAADLAGLEAGDIVIRYADKRVFSFRGLQRSTTEGNRDQPVAIQIQRNGELIDFVIPRGPMGVTLSGISG